MRTGTIRIIDGKYIDHYTLGQIDITHFHMRLTSGMEQVTHEQVKQGSVYHVAQLAKRGTPMYEAIWAWLKGDRELENVGFGEVVQ